MIIILASLFIISTQLNRCECMYGITGDLLW